MSPGRVHSSAHERLSSYKGDSGLSGSELIEEDDGVLNSREVKVWRKVAEEMSLGLENKVRE